MIKLSPRQRAAVDQSMAAIREEIPGTLDVCRDSQVTRLAVLDVLDDIIVDPLSAFARLLAWKELLGD